MNETNTSGASFIGYEYHSVTVPHDMEAVYTDGYANFGWTQEGSETHMAPHGSGSIDLKFKRDRKIRNKAELTRLQRQFEEFVGEIIALESAKTTAAAIAAYTIGVIGTAFMAGSVFAYIGGPLMLSIILAIPGFLGWITPYFSYCKIKKDKTARLSPIISQKYDEIYSTCEKANSLLG